MSGGQTSDFYRRSSPVRRTDALIRALHQETLGSALPIVGEQKDIRYIGVERNSAQLSGNDADGLLVDQSVRRLRLRMRVLLRAVHSPLGARPAREGEP